jgi:hypothetical protein
VSPFPPCRIAELCPRREKHRQWPFLKNTPMTTTTPHASVGGIPLWARGRVGFTPQTPGVYKAYLKPVKPWPEPSGSALLFALSTRKPTDEGNGWQELEAFGYTRQPLVFELNAARNAWSNTATVSFGPVTADWVKATYLGIFDGDQLLYYGAVIPHVTGGRPTHAIEFWRHTIQVKA